jgi:hypothetical protein
MMRIHGDWRSVPVLVERLVDHVPALDAPLVATDDVEMCSFIRASSSSRDSGCPCAFSNTHRGVWLCHTSVCPTMNIPYFSPNATYASEGAKSYWAGCGCTRSHFSTFSGVIALELAPDQRHARGVALSELRRRDRGADHEGIAEGDLQTARRRGGGGGAGAGVAGGEEHGRHTRPGDDV